MMMLLMIVIVIITMKCSDTEFIYLLSTYY